jgi:spermidine synthase
VRDEQGRPVGGRPEPLTYYYFGGPISQAVEMVRQARGGLERVAVVGLGTGSMACHKRDGESWRFYEIDPEVIRLARDPRIFRFLSACGPDVAIVVGDARITLSASADRYDLIVLDAFSSDAIPVHLLTREAFAAYRAKLKPNGAIAVHVSNRYMELASVVAAVGAAEGLVAYFGRDEDANDFRKDYRAKAEVVALAGAPADLGALTSLRNWRSIEAPPSLTGWSDDYSDVLGALLRKRFDR